jgi:hypothetical protein
MWIVPAGEKGRWDGPHEGYFHKWGIDFEEFESGAGCFTTGIVENKYGEVFIISDPTKIRFVAWQSKEVSL